MYHSHHSTAQNGAPVKKVIRNHGPNGSKLPYNNASCDAECKNDCNTKDCNDANSNTESNNNKNNVSTTGIDDNNNNSATNNYKNDTNSHAENYNNNNNKYSKASNKNYNFYESTPSKNTNAKYQYSDSQYQHGASVSINRENVYNPSDISTYGSSLYPPYQPQYMPYYPVDGNEQQPNYYMPLNVYTQPGKNILLFLYH